MSAERIKQLRIEKLREIATDWYNDREDLTPAERKKGINSYIESELLKDKEKEIREAIKRLITALDSNGLREYFKQFKNDSDRKIVKEIVINEWAVYKYCPLNHAVQIDSIEIMEELLKFVGQTEINIGGYERPTPLITAILEKNVRMVKYLLSIGAETSIVDRWKISPLVIAINNNSQEIIRILLKAGADVNAVYDPCQERIHMRQTALVQAIQTNQPELVKLLIKHGLSPRSIELDLEYLRKEYATDKLLHSNDAMRCLLILQSSKA
jgi:hypothetical protein